MNRIHQLMCEKQEILLILLIVYKHRFNFQDYIDFCYPVEM